jgi:carbonic anhydrase
VCTDASGLGKYFPTGGGKHQSPIDIITSEAKFDESLGDGGFTFGYTARDAQSVTNTGNSLVINFAENANSSKTSLYTDVDINEIVLAMTAVHYTGEQQLRQVVLHWGTEPMNGSEHLIGGVGYAGEVQLVHMNTKYTSWDEALKHADGLAIICVFLNVCYNTCVVLTNLYSGGAR